MHGWVYFGELDTETAPERFDEVVTLEKPHPVKRGDVLAYLGEDVPVRARPIANQPVTRRLLHLEVFSGDDVPAYLTASRHWSKQWEKADQRTLLVLPKGTQLLDKPEGSVAFTLDWSQILPCRITGESVVNGARWRRITQLRTPAGLTASGWFKEEGHTASPWEWPGFEVVDEPASDHGGFFADVTQMVCAIRKKGPRPDETQFYQALRRMVDTNRDGQVTEEELDAVLRSRSKAAHIARIIARHDSEWHAETMGRMCKVVINIAEQLGFEAVKQVQDEMPRAEKLPWWDQVAASVPGFPKSPRVYHFHPGGLAAGFKEGAIRTDDIIRRIGDVISHGEGGYESYNTGTRGVPGGRVGYSFLHPPAGTVTAKKINEILSTEPLLGTDKSKMFATGKYQTILSTLRTAKTKLGLSGDERYDEDMQERVFREYLFEKAGGGALAGFVNHRRGDIDDAMYGASKEWASIASPAGRRISDGRISDGRMSYYEHPGTNSANPASTSALRDLLSTLL